MSDVAERAAREGVQFIEQYLAGCGDLPACKVLVCVMCDDGSGAIAGRVPDADPAELLADAIEFTTIIAGAAGKQLTVDGGEP